MTEEQIAKLAREVEVECLAVPGTSFYSVAEMAIEETLALLADGGKGEAVYQVLEPCEATWSDVDWLTYESTDGAFKRVLYTAPQAECAPREAQPVADTVRECLSDVVSHYRALYAGLAFQLNEATNTENSDDMAYWKHEIKALERMYVQAESAALAAPTPEAQPIPKLKPRRIKLVDDEGDPLPEATPTPDERADAGNDAERYRWLREQDDSGPLYTAPQAECAPRAKERLWLMVADNFTRAEFEQAFAECAPRMWIETGHFGSNEPSRLAPVPAPREAQPVVLVNRGALQAALNMLRRDAQEGRHARGELADEISASIAVPTPERAQPVGPRTTLNYDGTFDTTCAHCGGNGCFACLKSAAPTPERAEKSAKQQYDASGCAEEEPDPIERLRFFCSLAMNGQDWIDVEPFFDAITPERADAGKDAALYEAARLLASRLPTGLALASYFAAEELNALRAILAANKEPPERAEPRALPDWRIADGWHNTFSTSNPYCPCDLKSFTKAVRWAEHAIEQAVKERK